MRKLLHLLFGWDYVYISGWGISRMYVNQDGMYYVMYGKTIINIRPEDFKSGRSFFIHGSILDYFSPNEIEDIHGTTHSQ